LRLAEWSVLAWGVVTAAVYTTSGESGRGRFFDANFVYNPLFTVLLCILCRYLLEVILVEARGIYGLGRRLAADAAGGPGSPFEAGREAEILRAFLRFLRDVAPLFLVIVSYKTTDFLIERLRGSYLADRALARIDLLVFGGHASVWAQRFITPALTDWLSFCYFMHLVVPTFVLLFLNLRAPRRLFVEATQGFVVILIIGFSLYVAVPAVGPKYELAAMYTRDLSGGLMGDLNRVVMDLARVPRDAFPSLHVGLSALLLVYAWRASRWFALLLSPFIVGNWIGTIYLRYHYSIDLLAGFLLVPLVHELVRSYMRRFPEEDLSAPGSEGLTT
jgi:hypothetical protein